MDYQRIIYKVLYLNRFFVQKQKEQNYQNYLNKNIYIDDPNNLITPNLESVSKYYNLEQKQASLTRNQIVR